MAFLASIVVFVASTAFAEQEKVAGYTMSGWKTVVYRKKPAKLPDLPKILRDFDEEIEKVLVIRNRCLADVQKKIGQNVASHVILEDLRGECKSVETEIRRMVAARDETYRKAYEMIRSGHSNDKELVNAFANFVKFNPLHKWKCPVNNDALTLCAEAPGVHGVNVENVQVGANRVKDVDFKSVRQEALPNFFQRDAWKNYTFTATLKF